MANFAKHVRVDPIRALMGLTLLAMKHPDPLLGHNVDPDDWWLKVEYVRGEHAHLMKKTGDETQRTHTRIIRNQAFTHLKESVDTVCACAREVFKGNEARLPGYRAPNFTLGFVQQDHTAAAK
jgi:hypothetical protein